MLWSSPARPKRTTVSCATLHTLAAPHPFCDQMLSHEKPLLQRPLCAGVATAKTAWLSATWCCPLQRRHCQQVICTTVGVALPVAPTSHSYRAYALHASVRPGQTSAPAAQSARSAHQQTMAGAGRIRWACGARVCTSFVVLLQTAARDLRLCVVAGAAGLPCPLQVLKNRHAHNVAWGLLLQRSSSRLRCCNRQGGRPWQVAGSTAQRLLPSPRLG